MREFFQLLRRNRNYRYTWMGQIVSEIGDNFNNIAVFALAMALTHSGMVVTGVLLARAVPAIAMGPVAGVLLDRLDRKQIMIASDLMRALVALGFIFSVTHAPHLGSVSVQYAAHGRLPLLHRGALCHPADDCQRG
ncbi:MAG: MFS transporter [Acidobacteriaceae bacterium]